MPCGLQRCEVYHVGGHRVHDRLPDLWFLAAVREAGLGRGGRLGGYDHRLGVPDFLLRAESGAGKVEGYV